MSDGGEPSGARLFLKLLDAIESPPSQGGDSIRDLVREVLGPEDTDFDLLNLLLTEAEDDPEMPDWAIASPAK